MKWSNAELMLCTCDTALFDIDRLNLNFQLSVFTSVPNISRYDIVIHDL